MNKGMNRMFLGVLLFVSSAHNASAVNYQCSVCPIGQYKSATSNNECVLCPPDTYQDTLGATSATHCKPCPANSYAPAGSGGTADCLCGLGYTGDEACLGCTAGKYKASNGTEACTSCAAGTASPTEAATSAATCVTCAIHTHAAAGASACTVCPPDSSTVGTGSESLSFCRCNAGYAPAPNATADTTNTTGRGCTACRPGTYNWQRGREACINCAGGKYGTDRAATAASMCLDCPANTFSFPASTLPTNCSCNAGYSGSTNGEECVACIAGTYKTARGIGTCTSCGVNKYSTAVAQAISNCSSCPAFSQAPAGSDEAGDCLCNAGYTGANGSVCLGCVQGTYKTVVGPSACALCGNNTYSSAVAATSSGVCTGCQSNAASLMGSTRQSDCHCLMGYLTQNLGAANEACEICSAGSYNAQLKATTCSSCGAGLQSSAPGAVSAEQCTECLVNTYSAAGAAQCEMCPIHTFAPARSNHLNDCKCLSGYYSAVAGEDGLPCSACQAGKHKAQTGAVDCTDCFANQYSTATAATSNATCIRCTANAVSPVGSSTSTMCLCTTGFTGANAIGCSGCTVGKFKATTGADACTDCPANTYSGLTEQKSNATCTPCYDNSISLPASDAIDDCSCSAGFEFS